MSCGDLAEHYAGYGLSGADAYFCAQSGIDPRELFEDEPEEETEEECE
jgi:hypothetical protein